MEEEGQRREECLEDTWPAPVTVEKRSMGLKNLGQEGFHGLEFERITFSHYFKYRLVYNVFVIVIL